jgi:hypothetical protein
MTRRTIVRNLVAWTLGMLLIGVLLAVRALWSVHNAKQACFFDYPAVPCPGGDDPAAARLTLAFFGVPLVWVVGLVVAALALRMRRHAR